jgi:malate dehydrogenase (oxaloacetate-decarboxylating)(NADP+)
MEWNGKLLVPGQGKSPSANVQANSPGNNMYVFPGIGLAAILCKAVHITQDMIYASGEYLSRSLNAKEQAAGYLYPAIDRIREVSVVVTRGVIRAAQQNGVDGETSLRSLTDEQLDEFIRHKMYDPFHQVKALEQEIHHVTKTNGNGEEHYAEEPRAVAGAHL